MADGVPTTALFAVLLVTMVALGQVGCARASKPPTHLVDGTPVQHPLVTLEGAPSVQILTRAIAADPRRALPGRVETCLSAARGRTPRKPAVIRTGVLGSSVTFRTTSGREVVACDGTGPNRPWCGRALGRLHGGHLLDPRLDLASCSTVGGDRLAFTWIEPDNRARYVAVRRDGYAEVYPVLARLPVRVATDTNIDLGTSSASLEISEHDSAGGLLRSYTATASVAG